MSDKAVQATLLGGGVVEFEDVDYDLEIPPLENYTGADGSEAYIAKAGSFAIKSPEFEGWFNVEGFTIGGHYYEVARTFHQPRQSGEWLVYSVRR